MSVVRKGAKSGEIVWRSEEGMGSRGQEVARFDLMSLSTSSGERGEKEENSGAGGREVGLVVGVELLAAGGRKEELISSTFLVKKFAKSSAEREEGGGGGGGLRRAEKVLNSLLGLEADD